MAVAKRVMGIDPSLNSLGIAYRCNGEVLAYAVGSKGEKGSRRIAHLRDCVSRALDKYKPDIVAYEGYALGFRGKSNTIFDLGELGGVLKLLILEKGIDILLVPPTSLKLFATGKGNADKEQVSSALRELLGVSFSTSDQYDAAGLLLMGEMYYSRTRLLRGVIPAYKKKAIESSQFLEAF